MTSSHFRRYRKTLGSKQRTTLRKIHSTCFIPQTIKQKYAFISIYIKHTTDRLDFINFSLNMPNRCINIHNIYISVAVDETSIIIPILEQRLAAHSNREHIALKESNLDHDIFGGPSDSKTLVKEWKKRGFLLTNEK